MTPYEKANLEKNIMSNTNHGDIVFNPGDTRLVVRRIIDSCVASIINKYSQSLDQLNMDTQLTINDRVREWRQRIEDSLCDHLESNNNVTEKDVKRLISNV